MKLNLLNVKSYSDNNSTCHMYWKCSMYEYDTMNKIKPVSKFIGLSKDNDIVTKTYNMCMHMKLINNTVSYPIITLQKYDSLQNEYINMNLYKN